MPRRRKRESYADWETGIDAQIEESVRQLGINLSPAQNLNHAEPKRRPPTSIEEALLAEALLRHEVSLINQYLETVQWARNTLSLPGNSWPADLVDQLMHRFDKANEGLKSAGPSLSRYAAILTRPRPRKETDETDED